MKIEEMTRRASLLRTQAASDRRYAKTADGATGLWDTIAEGREAEAARLEAKVAELNDRVYDPEVADAGVCVMPQPYMSNGNVVYNDR